MLSKLLMILLMVLKEWAREDLPGYTLSSAGCGGIDGADAVGSCLDVVDVFIKSSSL